MILINVCLLSFCLLSIHMFVGSEALSTYSTSACTCATGKMTFDIYDKTDNTGTFETKCVTGSFTLTPTATPVGDQTKACYAKCANPCKTPTVECVEIAAMKTDKPGKCPDNDQQKAGFYTNECTTDKNCEGQKKCCLQKPSNTKKCINPVVAGKSKCGSCVGIPFHEAHISNWFFDRACSKDDMCTGSDKCCPFATIFGSGSKCYRTTGSYQLP